MDRIYIKDLYDSKKVINSFPEVEFESLKAFINCRKHKLFRLSKKLRTIIPINTIEEFDIIANVGLKTELFELGNINLYITDPDVLEEIIRHKMWVIKYKPFWIVIDPIIKSKGRRDWRDVKEFNIWSKKNPLFIRATITYDNYKTIVNDLISIYNTKELRFFEISFDYASFEQMTLEELHEFEFRIKQLRIWHDSTRGLKNGFEVDKLILRTKSFKKIFISEDLKLYLTKQAFEEGVMLFDLGKNLDKTGETLHFRELSELRQYIDLHSEALVNARYGDYIDFYQNLKVMGHINECPHLHNVIGDILGSF